jgi:hypothetical protein
MRFESSLPYRPDGRATGVGINAARSSAFTSSMTFAYARATAAMPGFGT